MTAIMNGRRKAHADIELVAFIMGMRINRRWLIQRWQPRNVAMTTMAREFVPQPKRRHLCSKAWFQRTAAIISDRWPLGALATYRKVRECTKVSDWPGFSRKTGNNDTVGTRNNADRIVPGWLANVLVSMPAFLTGNCTILIEAWHEFATATGRMGRLAGDRDARPNASGQTATNDQSSSRARPLVGSHR
jgi:hypothetical protein